MTRLYTEVPEKSESIRREYLDGILALCERGFEELPLSNSASELEVALGAPLDREVFSPCPVSQEYVGRDGLCEIYRLRFYPLPKTPFFALLFIPYGVGTPSPLVVAAHGLLGTPELMYGIHGKNGYSDLIARLLRKKVCVLAPQFLLWNCGRSPAKPCYATKYDRVGIDRALKERGGSMTSLEVFFLTRAFSALSNLRFLDMSRLGVCGMSYGAFLTLRTMAVSDAVRAGYFMSCFNGSLDSRWPEWAYREPYRTFSDSELCSLTAPRPVFVEVGARDDIFPVNDASREADKAREHYTSRGYGCNFRFSVWDGGHIVNPDDDGIDFLLGFLQ